MSPIASGELSSAVSPKGRQGCVKHPSTISLSPLIFFKWKLKTNIIIVIIITNIFNFCVSYYHCGACVVHLPHQVVLALNAMWWPSAHRIGWHQEGCSWSCPWLRLCLWAGVVSWCRGCWEPMHTSQTANMTVGEYVSNCQWSPSVQVCVYSTWPLLVAACWTVPVKMAVDRRVQSSSLVLNFWGSPGHTLTTESTLHSFDCQNKMAPGMLYLSSIHKTFSRINKWVRFLLALCCPRTLREKSLSCHH